MLAQGRQRQAALPSQAVPIAMKACGGGELYVRPGSSDLMNAVAYYSVGSEAPPPGVESPRTIVELGTHYGVSFFAFCQAVLDEGYPARLHAVDTWTGDPHAGEYGEEVIGVVHRVRDAAFPPKPRTLAP